MYQVKIIADVIDPTDPEYIKANNSVVKASKRFACIREMEHDGNVEIGIFTFPDKQTCLAFKRCPEHTRAMVKVRKFYRSMQIERSEVEE